MNLKLLSTFAIGFLTLSCAKLSGEEPQLNTAKYLTKEESEKINEIIFEIQKVLDTADNFRKEKALAYVQKLDIPGWRVYHRKNKVLFFTERLFVAEKFFDLPQTCIKDIANVQINICHIKIEQSAKKLGEAYSCNVESEAVNSNGLKEKVKISCSY